MFEAAKCAVLGIPVLPNTRSGLVHRDNHGPWSDILDIDSFILDIDIVAAVDGAVCNPAAMPGAKGPYADEKLRGEIIDSLGASLHHGMHPHQWAYHSSLAQTFEAFFRDVVKLDLPGDTWARSSAYTDMKAAGLIWTHPDFAMVCERPLARHLEEKFPTHDFQPIRRRLGFPNYRRLHNERGPAILWRDGTALWFLCGINVSRQIVEQPETLSVQDILDERYVELRRLMIDRVGAQRILREGSAVEIARDPDGTLWQLDLRGDEPLLIVQVRNSTPEPISYMPTEHEAGEWQGQRWAKHYYLRVPPSMKSVREAVAWTFEMSVDEYAPFTES